MEGRTQTEDRGLTGTPAAEMMTRVNSFLIFLLKFSLLPVDLVRRTFRAFEGLQRIRLGRGPRPITEQLPGLVRRDAVETFV